MSELASGIVTIVRSDEGQDLAEYALVMLLLVVAAIGGVTAFGGDLRSYWVSIVTVLPL